MRISDWSSDVCSSDLSIGAVYAWSVFGGALETADAWNLSKVKASMPFTVTIGMVFIGSYLGGRLQDRHGPRIVALGGGVIYAVGIVLASFTNGADDYWLVLLGYGVIRGFGRGERTSVVAGKSVSFSVDLVCR